MAGIKKHIALVLLGIFLLVKLGPAFLSGQLFPMQRGHGVHTLISAVGAAGSMVVLIRVDKCIIYADSFNTVPKIKFAGILFALLFVSVFSLITRKFKQGQFLDAVLPPSSRRLSLGVLRI